MAALQSDPESRNNSAPPVLISDPFFPTCPSLTLPSDVSGVELENAKGIGRLSSGSEWQTISAAVFSFITRLKLLRVYAALEVRLPGRCTGVPVAPAL